MLRCKQSCNEFRSPLKRLLQESDPPINERHRAIGEAGCKLKIDSARTYAHEEFFMRN